MSSSPTTDHPLSGDFTLSLPHAHGGPAGTGTIRSVPEDFQVFEDLGYQATGDGEHLLLVIRKTKLTTNEVAAMLARHAGVRRRDVSFAGMKDKQAVTTQAFSIHLPGRPDPDWDGLETDQLVVLESNRHSRKIRRGALRGNRFILRIRNVEADRQLLQQRISAVARSGVPNYFGPQRFGRSGENLQLAKRLFEGSLTKPGRQLKGILLSSVRSWLFNLVLAERVAQGNWNRVIPGDVMLLVGSNRQFLADQDVGELQSRVDALDINPSAPLNGRSSRSLRAALEAAQVEQRVLSDRQFWLSGLERFGLTEDRRSLRLLVDDLQCEWAQDDLVLGFSLPAGSYATVVLRELLMVQSLHLRESST